MRKKKLKENLDKLPCGGGLGADVAEVRHGNWLMPLTDKPWQRGYFCRCSVCKYINCGHTLNVPDFCENCGAKMDGERSEK